MKEINENYENNEELSLDQLEDVAGGVGLLNGIPGTYLVQAGDTIASIAERFGIDPVTLIKLNMGILALSNGDELLSGLIETLRNDLPDPQRLAEFVARRLVPGIRLRLR